MASLIHNCSVKSPVKLSQEAQPTLAIPFSVGLDTK